MMNENFEMFFEITIRLFLGDKAFHIAGLAHSTTDRKHWYRKVLKSIIRGIQLIDTNTRHKKQLASTSEAALRMLNERTFNEAAFTLHLLRLIAALFGLTGVTPCRVATLAYFQTPNQHHTEHIAEGRQGYGECCIDEKNSVSIRKRIVSQLKSEGLSDYQVSLVLNMSEYQVKKLRKEL